ncbi:MAG: PD40 domain-containing protein [Anaerolineales bacterium]|nr:PD40 domain-containing protein [Anaerolineales bacterium]
MTRWPVQRLIVAGLAAALTTTACLPGTLNLPLPSIDVDRITNQNGLIAYRGDDGNIYIVNPLDTSLEARPTQVTSDAKAPVQDEAEPYRVYGLPSWSPDGLHLAFSGVSGTGQNFPTTNQVLLANREGVDVHATYEGEHWPIYYNWSPTSAQLGVLTQSAAGQTFALRRVNVDGGDSEAIDTGSPLFWAWAPDGSALLVHASNTRLAALQLGAVVQERDLGLALGLFQAPAISPNGQHALAAAAASETRQQLVRIDLATGQPQPLIDVVGLASFTWSPDGERVAVIDRTTDNKYQYPAGPLQVLTAADGAIETTVDEDVIAFFWAPNAKRLAYLALVDPKDGASQPNVTLKLLDVGGWTPREVVVISPTDAFFSQIVPLFDQFSQSTSPWSPDSSSFVLTFQESSSSAGVYLINLDGASAPRRVGSGDVAFWSSK